MTGWDELDEGQREVDMRIGEAVAEAALPAAAAELEREKATRIVSAVFACRTEACPKLFALYRAQDVTGVSGTGTVAHGVQFADGTVVLRWTGEFASTVVWESLEAAMHVHGHDGKTRVVWLAAEFSEMALAEEEAATAERERIAAEIEAESATHLFAIRPAMRWAAWVARGKPAGDDPGRDMAGRAPGVPCCPVETAAVARARASERARIAAAIPPGRLRGLADWFDTDDEFKTNMFPGTWPHRGHEVQDDLRAWADLLEGP